MSLFTADTHFVVYMNAKDPTPSQELRSREALAPVFAELNKYDATTHFVGQSTIFTLTDDRGTGEAYCLAHHVTVDGGKRRLMIASLRYLDAFVKIDGAWLFAERRLCRLDRGARTHAATNQPAFRIRSPGDPADDWCGPWSISPCGTEERKLTSRTLTSEPWV
jgi:hypothetical protein